MATDSDLNPPPGPGPDVPAGDPAAIGASFAADRSRLRIALAVGLLVTGGDLAASYFLVLAENAAWLPHVRGWTFFAVCLLYGRLTDWDWDTLGLRLGPLDLRYWMKASLVLGGIVLAACALAAAGAAAAVGMGWIETFPEISSMFRTPGEWGDTDPPVGGIGISFWPYALDACVIAPLTEEPVYRFALCVPLVALVGRGWTIFVSGILFAALHYAYGTLWPTNAVAGFVLAWAYLRSGSLAVPVALHALGNLCVALFHLGLLYATT